MAFSVAKNRGITQEEWDGLNITFGCDSMARVVGTNVRYVQNHAKELGGTKVGGHWVFSKPRVASDFGLA